MPFSSPNLATKPHNRHRHNSRLAFLLWVCVWRQPECRTILRGPGVADLENVVAAHTYGRSACLGVADKVLKRRLFGLDGDDQPSVCPDAVSARGQPAERMDEK